MDYAAYSTVATGTPGLEFFLIVVLYSILFSLVQHQTSPPVYCWRGRRYLHGRPSIEALRLVSNGPDAGQLQGLVEKTIFLAFYGAGFRTPVSDASFFKSPRNRPRTREHAANSCISIPGREAAPLHGGKEFKEPGCEDHDVAPGVLIPTIYEASYQCPGFRFSWKKRLTS